MQVSDFMSQQDLTEIFTPNIRKTAAGALVGAGLAASSMIGLGYGLSNTTDTTTINEPLPIPRGKPEIKSTPTPKISSQAQSSNIPAPRMRPSTKDLSPVELKAQFIDKMVPMIKSVNDGIDEVRNKVEEISHKKVKNKSDLAYISKLMSEYNVTDGDITTLIARLQPIPVSLALAQSAVESGWGTSRLSQDGNVMFGQKKWTDDENTIKASEDGTKYAAFGDPKDSIEAYARNLNSHPAYKHLRAARWWLKTEKGRNATGLDLAPHLTKYSTKGDEYTKQIARVIRQNDLTKWDNS